MTGNRVIKFDSNVLVTDVLLGPPRSPSNRKLCHLPFLKSSLRGRQLFTGVDPCEERYVHVCSPEARGHCQQLIFSRRPSILWVRVVVPIASVFKLRGFVEKNAHLSG